MEDKFSEFISSCLTALPNVRWSDRSFSLSWRSFSDLDYYRRQNRWLCSSLFLWQVQPKAASLTNISSDLVQETLWSSRQIGGHIYEMWFNFLWQISMNASLSFGLFCETAIFCYVSFENFLSWKLARGLPKLIYSHMPYVWPLSRCDQRYDCFSVIASVLLLHKTNRMARN